VAREREVDTCHEFIQFAVAATLLYPRAHHLNKRVHVHRKTARLCLRYLPREPKVDKIITGE
jgi:hypothetical protein